MKIRHKQSGTAIFMALLMVTLVTVISISWFLQTRLSIRQTQMLLNAEDARLANDAVVTLAINLLRGIKNPATETWPKDLPVLTFNGLTASGRISSAETRLNINNLADEETKNAFMRLLVLVDKRLNPAMSELIVKAIMAWTTPLAKLTPELKSLNQKYGSYQAGHQAFQNIEELRMVMGFDDELLTALKPYITALPMGSVMNFKNASPVLWQVFNIKTLPLDAKPGEFFLVSSEVEANHYLYRATTLLSRKVENGVVRVGVRWQCRELA